MNKREFIRNITIGLTDGVTIPFALVAGLSSVLSSSAIIAASGIALATGGAITMGIGSRLELRGMSGHCAPVTIFLSYLCGGLMAIVPFLFIDIPSQALKYSSAVSVPVLFIAGYFESKVNGANAWAGALRVALTGAIAAAAAYFVAKLFV